jgi:hypothetical protein
MKGNSPIGRLFRKNQNKENSLALDAVTYAVMHQCRCVNKPRLNVLIDAIITLDQLFIEKGQSQKPPEEHESALEFEDDYLEEESSFQEVTDEESGDRMRIGQFSNNSPEYFAFMNKHLSNDFADLENNKEIIQTIQEGLQNEYPPIVNAICEFVILQRGINLDAPSDPFGYIDIDPQRFDRFKDCFLYGTILSKVGINASLIRFSNQLAQLESVLGQIPSPEQLYIFHLGKCI